MDAGAILARLRGGADPPSTVGASLPHREPQAAKPSGSTPITTLRAPPTATATLRPEEPFRPPQPLASPAPLAAPLNAPTPALPPAPRPVSLQSSLETFGPAASDALLGYYYESRANSLALKQKHARTKRVVNIIGWLALIAAGASCGLSAAPLCDSDADGSPSETCPQLVRSITAATSAVACAALVAVSRVIGRSGGERAKVIAEDWEGLANQLYEALFLGASPSGTDGATTPAAFVKSTTGLYKYLERRTPSIDPAEKREALSAAQSTAHGSRRMVATV